MNPQLILGIGGAVAAVWGLIVAIFSDWARRVIGDEFMDGRPITVGFVRFLGIGLAVGGTVLVVLALTGVIPDH